MNKTIENEAIIQNIISSAKVIKLSEKINIFLNLFFLGLIFFVGILISSYNLPSGIIYG
jgi:hypothetical protein